MNLIMDGIVKQQELTMETQIKSISITNVRGISYNKFEFKEPSMIRNKIHIIVAPNGFGKSSIAQAFDGLKPKSMSLNDESIYKSKKENLPKIEIECVIDGVTKKLIADKNKNEISKQFSVFVINSKVKPKALAKTGFMPYAKPKPILHIDAIELVKKYQKSQNIKF